MTGPFADARDATAQHRYQVLVGFLRVGIGPVRGDAVALVHLVRVDPVGKVTVDEIDKGTLVGFDPLAEVGADDR